MMPAELSSTSNIQATFYSFWSMQKNAHIPYAAVAEFESSFINY
jgi:hypothetical protein